MITAGVYKEDANLLKSELCRRLSLQYVDPSSNQCDLIFIVATACDPRYKKWLTQEQKKAARDFLSSTVSI